MRYATSFALAVVVYGGICSLSLKPSPPPGEGRQLHEVTLIQTQNESPAKEAPTSAEMPFAPTTLAKSEAPLSTPDVLGLRPTLETPSDVESIEDPPRVHTPHLDPLATQEDSNSIPDLTQASSNSTDSEPVVDEPVTPEPRDAVNIAQHSSEETSILDTTEPPAESVGSQTVRKEPGAPEHHEATDTPPPVEEDTSILDASETSSDPGESEPVVDEPVGLEHRWLAADTPPVAHEHHELVAVAPTVAPGPLGPAVALTTDPYAHLELPNDLMQLPDLVISPPPEESDWSAIDKKLGIETVAYSIDGRQPNIYFVWEADGSVEQVETLDRTGFSNRCRDRNQIEYFRRRLRHATRRFGIRRPMRIIGFVPVETDQRFALAQTLAIESEGLEPEAVAHTLAQYDLSAKAGIRIDGLPEQ